MQAGSISGRSCADAIGTTLQNFQSLWQFLWSRPNRLKTGFSRRLEVATLGLLKWRSIQKLVWHTKRNWLTTYNVVVWRREKLEIARSVLDFWILEGQRKSDFRGSNSFQRESSCGAGSGRFLVDCRQLNSSSVIDQLWALADKARSKMFCNFVIRWLLQVSNPHLEESLFKAASLGRQCRCDLVSFLCKHVGIYRKDCDSRVIALTT